MDVDDPLPELTRAIVAARDEKQTIRRNSQRPHRTPMFLQVSHQDAARRPLVPSLTIRQDRSLFIRSCMIFHFFFSSNVRQLKHEVFNFQMYMVS